MKAFADLFAALNETTKTSDKTRALAGYFAAVAPADGAWAVYFLLGRKPKRPIAARQLASWAVELAQIADWEFDESYQAVGDLAETIALLLPAQRTGSHEPLHFWVEERLLRLKTMTETERKAAIQSAWGELDDRQRFVWNKLLTGGFRIGVSQQLVVRALAQVAQLDPAVIAHRLMGEWTPTAEFFGQLLTRDGDDSDASRPYPFFLAHPLEDEPNLLGEVAEWQAEWKWDGIRAQLIHRNGGVFCWSRGEENVTERFPEIATAAKRLPKGTVLDGEILPFRDGRVMAFADLQRRLGRKTVGKKLLAEIPVIFMAYDLLEHAEADIRSESLSQRRALLAAMLADLGPTPAIGMSEPVEWSSWLELAQARQQSRRRGVEGLMLKRVDSPYRSGRQKGDWWKWKIAPLTIDAVLLNAQPGHGKRASLFTDYTFGVWLDGKLVPFAKAYSGLTDAEIREVDAFVRQHTTERFGPVRAVQPRLVFELAFEGIQRSTRHKSGIAVRFPRMHRWRRDKQAPEANSLADLYRLLADTQAQSSVGDATEDAGG